MPKQILTREQIVAASLRRKTVDVDIDRWDGSVRIQELSTAEMFAFRRDTKDSEEDEVGLKLLALCWVDGDGARMFDGDDGLEALGAVPIEVLTQLTDSVLSVNGLGGEAVEVAEKN